MGVAVLVGTRKGLFVLTSDETRRDWKLEGPHLTGFEVFHATRDPRDGTVHAATNNWVYGATAHRSSDLGETWERAEQIGLPEESGLTWEKSWHVEPGHPDEPGTMWLGGTPGALFKSTDGGATWEPVQSLIEHPTREKWNPGAGGLCCHSIQVDPSNPQRIYIAISAAGGFRSEDGGGSWTPINKNVAADFFPDNPYPEVGQCVHKLLVHPAKPERLWQQNHCGVYRSDDRGDSWERLEDNGLPSGFGFPLALDPADPDAAYVIPEEGAENRVTPNGRLGVYRTRDGGASWDLLQEGLPQQAWASIMREGMSFDGLDPVGIYAGTQGGSVFVSPDAGDSWVEAARFLPTILSVESVEWQ
ncbi:MAG: exo-alpha-sialidase [Gaiellaceae bacterium]